LRLFVITLLLTLLVTAAGCRRANTEFVTIALPEPFSGFDTLTSDKSDAAAERVRNLMFNSLVRKTETFDYTGELAEAISVSEEGKEITFKLRNGVKFHNGNDFTSADVKYTFDQLFASKGSKRLSFYETTDGKQVAHIDAIETPDPQTVVFRISKASLKNQLLSNLVAIPIVPSGTIEQQRSKPLGSGPFKFVSFDQSQNIVEFEAFQEYWEGAPQIKKVRVKTIADASSLQAELQMGGVDIAPLPSNLPPDSLNALKRTDSLKVEQFDGSNIQYLGFNTESAPLNDVRIRQAIGYGIDRNKIINELLSGQAKVAHSILPDSSWAYTVGTEYTYDPERAKELLKAANYQNQPIRFTFASGNAAYSSYAQAIQSMLGEIGLNIQIETMEPNTIREQLSKGQFQINTGVWIGGNQDPIFLKDLFTTRMIPGPGVSCCNRGRYSNPEVDRLLEAAIEETDPAKAAETYKKAWEIISRDVPLFPLWYPANMVVANKRIENISISPSGDWSFVKDLRIVE
jgi:peptide/nickel transport system substrate-binding protein